MDEVVVGTYANQVEAEMWAEVLRGAGIPCRTTRASVELAAVGFNAWVPHELRVLGQDAARAMQLLPPPDDAGVEERS